MMSHFKLKLSTQFYGSTLPIYYGLLVYLANAVPVHTCPYSPALLSHA